MNFMVSLAGDSLLWSVCLHSHLEANIKFK